MAIATINISLPDTLKREVEEIIASEGYGNTSEFFRDLVRDYLKTRQERRLEALLLEGLESGKATPLTKTDFEEIKRRGLERIKNKAKQMAFDIYKRPQAARDIEECIVYISEDNLDTGVYFLVAVDDAIEQLTQFPKLGLTLFLAQIKAFAIVPEPSLYEV